MKAQGWGPKTPGDAWGWGDEGAPGLLFLSARAFKFHRPWAPNFRGHPLRAACHPAELRTRARGCRGPGPWARGRSPQLPRAAGEVRVSAEAAGNQPLFLPARGRGPPPTPSSAHTRPLPQAGHPPRAAPAPSPAPPVPGRRDSPPLPGSPGQGLGADAGGRDGAARVPTTRAESRGEGSRGLAPE